MKPIVILLACLNFGLLNADGSSIDVQFHYGVEARNKLDTIEGTYTKDLISDSSITVPFSLTPRERSDILAKADSIGFFRMPTNMTIEHSGCMQTPYQDYFLRIKTREVDHSVVWNDRYCGEVSDLIELRTLIVKIIEAKKEYQALPLPKGGYL